MTRTWLHWPALGIAALGAAVIPLGAFSRAVRDDVFGPLALVEAIVATVLFLRMLLDGQIRRSIAAVNTEMRGDQPFGARRIRLLDPEWGLFGWRAGDLPLLIVRAILTIEFIVTALLMNALGNRPLYLAFPALFVAMMLSILHAGMVNMGGGELNANRRAGLPDRIDG